MLEVFKASSKSNPNQLAGAIAGVMRKDNDVEVQAIGAAAINQTVKAVAIARGFLAPSGIDIVCFPAFQEINIQGGTKTSIKIHVEQR